MTIPSVDSFDYAKKILEGNEEKILARLSAARVPQFTPDYHIEAPLFRLRISVGTLQHFFLEKREDVFVVVCSKDTDFYLSETQNTLRTIIEQILMGEAKRVLLPMLAKIASRVGMSYHQGQVRNMHSRWGSCSARRDISLACYLLLLPIPLIEYILIHELCHIREMNHSPRFWALVDGFLSGTTSKELREQLKAYRCSL